MRFNDLQFTFFLVATFLVARSLPPSRLLGTAWLTGMSLLFYGAWDPRFLWLLGAATLLDYGVGAALGREERPARRRLLLAVSVVGNLGMLGVFKYGDFVLEGIERITGVPTPRIGIALPIGISFYSFQTLSYSIDIYRRKLRPARNLLDFALFVSFFPQLVAGPIVRASEFLPQLDAPPRRDHAALGEGIALICIGLAKKLVLGDGIGRALVDPFFAAPGRYNGPEALLADWAAYFALYCDFSGYTDIALGAALLFGYRLPPNFDRPAFAPSPLEHWRRWHMTLGTFLRDYLYLPLGGSRVGSSRLWLNLFLVFFVSGVWHGVGMSYVVMGIYNGVLAATWRLLRPTPATGALGVGERLVAFQLTALSVICLRPIPLQRLGEALTALTRWDAPAGGLAAPWAVGLLLTAIGLHLSPPAWKAELLSASGRAPAAALALGVVVAGGVFSLYALGARDFYYFQF
jgi:D-alanyl-lipoteichoic acid acyltransferase DltB (MBOAT superfamily)